MQTFFIFNQACKYHLVYCFITCHVIKEEYQRNRLAKLMKVDLKNLTKGCLHLPKSRINNQKALYSNSIFSEGD